MADFVNGFLDILKKQKSIGDKEFDSLKKDFAGRSQDTLVYFLIDQGMVPKNEVLSALSKYFQVPSFDVSGYMFDHNLVASFDEDLMTSQCFIPLNESDDILVVITDNPDSSGLDELILENTDAEVVFYVGIKRDILDAIQEFYEVAVTEDEIEDEEEEFDEDDFSITDDLD